VAYTVVIPAYNAERTIGAVLGALAGQTHPPAATIVVDDVSTDNTASIAEGLGARVIRADGRLHAGGARNRGWAEAKTETVVFLDSDVIPSDNWSVGLERALTEFPGTVIGCARSFAPATAWGWVSHLQTETPYLPRGGPRDVAFVSSYCMAVPAQLPVRFDESYGGEDALFSVDAAHAGARLVFDPRFQAFHDHGRGTFAALRRQQDRRAYGQARLGPFQREGISKRIGSRFPIHYFALLRLPVIYRRLDEDAELRRRFVRLLPWMIVAEWTLGWSTLHYTLRRPPLRHTPQSGYGSPGGVGAG
jgi:glycosyltransferase involved in cell wall biosynthesis